MFEITKTTSHSIHLRDNEKTLEIEGESFERGHSSPDFVLYTNSIKRWKLPNGFQDIDLVEKKQITTYLMDELTKRHWKVVAE